MVVAPIFKFLSLESTLQLDTTLKTDVYMLIGALIIHTTLSPLQLGDFRMNYLILALMVLGFGSKCLEMLVDTFVVLGQRRILYSLSLDIAL